VTTVAVTVMTAEAEMIGAAVQVEVMVTIDVIVAAEIPALVVTAVRAEIFTAMKILTTLQRSKF